MMTTNEQKTCKICARGFSSKFSWVRYCSDICKKQAINNNYQNRKIDKICTYCGTSFKGEKRVLTSSCSTSCGSRIHKYNVNDIIEQFHLGLDRQELSEKFNVPYDIVSMIMSRNGLKTNTRNFNIPITAEQESIIRGSLLGDACALRLPSGICRVQFVHGPKQYGYLDWKYIRLKSITKSKPAICMIEKSFTGENKKFHTRTNHVITQICNEILDDNNKKVVNLEYLSKLDSLAIAVWMMDDGYLNNNCGTVSTHGFSYLENEMIAAWLSKRYYCKKPSITLDKRCNKHYISLHIDLCERIAKEIKHHVMSIPCMIYKIPTRFI